MRFHSGAAPVTPLTRCIGAPSKLPTHVATVTSRVNPTVHVSRKSDDVPVFTALGNGVRSSEATPNARARACASASMSVTSAHSDRAPTSRASRARVVPESSASACTRTGRPPFATAAYAPASSSSVTSPSPSASPRP